MNCELNEIKMKYACILKLTTFNSIYQLSNKISTPNLKLKKNRN